MDNYLDRFGYNSDKLWIKQMDRFIDVSCRLPKASASWTVDFGMILLLFGLVEFKYRSIKIWINIWISFRYTLDKADGQIYRRVMQPTKSLSILIYRLWHDVTRQRAFQYAIWMVIYCPACLAMKGLSHFFFWRTRFLGHYVIYIYFWQHHILERNTGTDLFTKLFFFRLTTYF